MNKKCSGDWEKLIQLYAKSGQWDEAFQLVNRNPELSSICWTLRADWLAERDMFIEAQQAFHQAGKKEEALFVLLKESSFWTNFYGFLDIKSFALTRFELGTPRCC